MKKDKIKRKISILGVIAFTITTILLAAFILDLVNIINTHPEQFNNYTLFIAQLTTLFIVILSRLLDKIHIYKK